MDTIDFLYYCLPPLYVSLWVASLGLTAAAIRGVVVLFREINKTKA